MNEARLKIAESIVNKTKDITFNGNKILSILLGGSVSRGIDDMYSDIELIYFFEHAPSLEDRETLIGTVSDKKSEINYVVNEDCIVLGMERLDFMYYSKDLDLPVLQDVLDFFIPDYSTIGLIDTINNSHVLYDDNFIVSVKEKCNIYPEELGENITLDIVSSIHNGGMNINIFRNNPTEFYQSMITVQKKLFKLLSAINKRYVGGYKWLYKELSEMEIKPQEIEEKFRSMFTMDKYEALDIIDSLVLETIKLAEEHYKDLEINADSIFERYNQKKQMLK